MTRRLLPIFLTLGACGAGQPTTASSPCVPGTVPPPPALTALSGPFATWAGKTRPLIGVATGDGAAAAAPYDVRYQYIAGGVAPGAGPCADCRIGCSASWWGCWQDTSLPPGKFVKDFIAKAKGRGKLPMLTYYQLLQSMASPAEGGPEVAAVNDAALLARYLADWRFLLQQVGTEKAILHVEPDFWGYGQGLSGHPAPSAIPAAVQAANPTDCSGQPDTLAGLGRCMIAMARIHAPNAAVGLHASGWGSGQDCFNNTYCPDPVAEGAKVGAWLKAAGADGGDFIASDMSDRDAAWYASQCPPADAACREVHWWTAANFDRAFAWAKAAAEAAGKPVFWWQTPVGNSAQGNLTDHWKDNRVEVLFTRMGDLAAAHGVGVAFGAGASGQTTPETDGGLLAGRTALYAAGGGVLACPRRQCLLAGDPAQLVGCP